MNGIEFLKRYFGDDSFIALKEWQGTQGTLGVYKSQNTTYLYMLVLVDADKGKYFVKRGSGNSEALALEDAQVLAAFAGAKEIK